MVKVGRYFSLVVGILEFGSVVLKDRSLMLGCVRIASVLQPRSALLQQLFIYEPWVLSASAILIPFC